jgi:hypothetical protein
MEGLLLLDSRKPSATLYRCRAKHAIDLEHNVLVRQWKSRKDARAWHRGITALHEAKCMLMLPPSFACPYSVLVKGAHNTAVSVTWLPPLESSHVVVAPKVFTNFTYFLRKAWRDAVYPNVKETRSTTVSLCVGADGTYYAMNCGIDDALLSNSAGGMVVDESITKPPHGVKVGANQMMVLMDTRRGRLLPLSQRHYLQARQMFQRISVQLKESYQSHLMYLSMITYLQGSLFSGGANMALSITRSVSSILEFAATLSKEETPLAILLYAICGELDRLSTVDIIKKITKKLLNTALFQPKLAEWQLDTRIVSDVCALMVTHIMEGRDDPVALRKNLETKRIANVAIVDVCSVWGMTLTDAQLRYGYSRTLALFAKAAMETVLVDHQEHHLPTLGARPPKALVEDQAVDDHPIPTAVAEVAFGIMQPLLLGVDARRLMVTMTGQMGAALVLSKNPVLNTNTPGRDVTFPLPLQVMSASVDCGLAAGERIVDTIQVGGWAMTYVFPLLHDPKRNNLLHLAKLVRILRSEKDEVSQLVGKALAVLICASVTTLNFFDTLLLKKIQSAGLDVIKGRCADREMLRLSLRFMESEQAARHVEMLVEDTQRWVASLPLTGSESAQVTQPVALPPQSSTSKQPRVPRRFGALDGTDASSGSLSYTTVKLPSMKKLDKKIYCYLIDTIADRVPQQSTMDEILQRPYVPQAKPPAEEVHLPPIDRDPRQEGDRGENWSSCESEEEPLHLPKGGDKGGHRSKAERKRRHEIKKRQKESKFDVFFRTIAMYREEDHDRRDIERLCDLHFGNMQVRFVNGLRSIQRKMWLRKRMGLDPKEFSSDESGASSSTSSSDSDPPEGLDAEGLAEWRAARHAATEARRREEKLKRRAQHGRHARYRKVMQESFPGGMEDFSRCSTWPSRELVSVRIALQMFQTLEEERQGRASVMLEEFETFSATAIDFDSSLWDL